MNQSKPKIFCYVCECWINPVGHEQRCQVKQPSATLTAAMTRLAWIGDTVHRLDIQAVAVIRCIPHGEAETFVQQYVSNAAMRDYVRVAQPFIVGSAHRIGTIFESRYFGEFRQNYLYEVFPAEAGRVLSYIPDIDCETLFGRDWWNSP